MDSSEFSRRLFISIAVSFFGLKIALPLNQLMLLKFDSNFGYTLSHKVCKSDFSVQRFSGILIRPSCKNWGKRPSSYSKSLVYVMSARNKNIVNWSSS